jgi:Fe-S-cluster-containing hydrogenase component 2
MSLTEKGYVSVEELQKFGQIPSDERFEKGPVAVLECIQEIPCNPCEPACNFGAITVNNLIELPKLDEAKCTGCGLCVAQCPGLAVFIVDKTYSDSEATVSFPYEYWPLPKEGDEVTGVSRSGEELCKAKVTKVLNPPAYANTPVVTIAVPKELAMEVRSIKRL